MVDVTFFLSSYNIYERSNSMKKVLSLLVIVAMVLSLVAGVAPRTVSAAEGAGPAPVVNIVYAPASVDVGGDFYVNAVVANAAGGTATISFDSGVELAAGETLYTKPAGVDCVGDVWWKLTCTAAGFSTITITSGADSKAVTVKQGDPVVQNPDFTITWLETPCDAPFNGEVAIGSLFSVKAKVVYHGTGLSDPVSLKLTLGPQLAFEPSTPADGIIAVGPMSSSREEIAAWNIKCTGLSEATFVAVSLALPEGVTANVPDPCYFDQGTPPPHVTPGNWDAVVYSPEKVPVSCGANLWDVRTVLTNGSLAASVGQVYAKLIILPNTPTLVVFVTGETGLKLMTPLLGDANPMAIGDKAEAIWSLMAMQPGVANFRI